MKKNFIVIIIIAFISISMIACSKTDITPQQTPSKPAKIVNTNRDLVVGFYFTWDEWGRKKFDCKKGGLCNFHLETIVIEYRCAPVLTDTTTGDHYVEVHVDDELLAEFEEEDYNLYIDEDIFCNAPDTAGTLYVLPEGIYEIDYSLGELGGYRLPLSIVE